MTDNLCKIYKVLHKGSPLYNSVSHGKMKQLSQGHAAFSAQVEENQSGQPNDSARSS